jgi:hypothetical protein
MIWKCFEFIITIFIFTESESMQRSIFNRLSTEKQTVESPEVSSVIVSPNSYKSIFNRLGDKKEQGAKEIESVIPQTSKQQKVILVQRVPAKALLEEKSKSSKLSTKVREKSVSFSSQDEILEIQR